MNQYPAVIETKDGDVIKLLNKETVLVDPASLFIHEANPRMGDVGALTVSYKKNGFYGSVIVDARDMRVLAGNHRVMAANALGMQLIPAQLIETDDELHAIRILIADNRHSDLATYNNEVLVELLQTVAHSEGGLLGTGYDGDDLDDLLAEVGQDAMPTDDVPEAQVDKAEELRQKWGVEYGQLWQVGRHRVLCGDSTSKEDVERLLDGAKFDLLFTSPPYAQQRDYGSNSDVSDWDALMQGVFSCGQAKKDAQVLVNLGLVHKDNEWIPYWENWINWMRNEGWRRFGFYVWDQGSGMPGNWNGRLGPSHEFVFHFNKVSKQPNKWVEKKPENIKLPHGTGFRKKDGNMQGEYSSHDAFLQATKISDSVIRVVRNMRRGLDSEHPATFPHELPAHIMKSYSGDGDVCYDPFSGSLTSHIAGEQIGRCVYGMEIQPEYIAVGMERLSLMGLTPELVTDQAKAA